MLPFASRPSFVKPLTAVADSEFIFKNQYDGVSKVSISDLVKLVESETRRKCKQIFVISWRVSLERSHCGAGVVISTAVYTNGMRGQDIVKREVKIAL